MEKPKHNWRRFWFPRDASFPLDHEGFVADLSVPQLRAVFPDALPTYELSAADCLVLLGEPGIGKSVEIETLLQTTREITTGTNDKVLSIDLRSVGTEQRLTQKLFDHPEFTAWKQGDYQLYLFLDSLDECLLRVATVATILVDELPELPVERLSLRIACRTAVWPKVLEDALFRLWQDRVTMRELLPLRAVDVITAARDYDLDADVFLGALSKARAIPFAIKPITLNFLIRMFQKDGTLPNSQWKLYEEGCRILCEETSESRRSAPNVPRSICDRRLAIAARVAAVTVFGRKAAILLGADIGALPDEIVPIRLLVGGTEPTGGEDVAVDEAVLRDTLDTGLFSSRGSELMGWAHQTYSEFLAAYWLFAHDLPPATAARLLDHQAESSPRIVPQLYETAAWVASVRPDVLTHIAEIDPHVLLMSDVAAMDETWRERIVAQILGHLDAHKLSVRTIQTAGDLRKLNHSKLAQQLQPYLTDSTKESDSRWVAIDIAEASSLVDLQDDLAAIALDTSTSYELRVQAAYAVVRIGDASCRSRLLPLASLSAEEDPNDNLRGCALEALWPEHISARQLFSVLTYPYHPNHVGAYQGFIHSSCMQHLSADDLPVALDWVTTQPSANLMLNPFSELCAQIIEKAFHHIEAPAVLDRLAVAIWKRLKEFEPYLYPNNQTQLRNDARRRLLVSHLVNKCISSGENITDLRHADPPLLMRDDLPWLIDQLAVESDHCLRRAYALLAVSVADLHTDDLDLLYGASQIHPELDEFTAPCFQPLRLDSPEAVEAKTNYEQYANFAARRPQPRLLLDPPPAARIERLLAAIDRGEISAWVQLNHELQLRPDSTHYDHELEDDITRLPGWQAAHGETRARIVTAAKLFVIEEEPNNESWLGSDELWFVPLAGYRALRLLLSVQPNEITLLPAATWAKWAASIIWYPHSDVGADSAEEKLVRLAYTQAPDETIRSLLLKVDHENAKLQDVFIVRQVERWMDAKIARQILDKVSDPVLTGASVRSLLEAILEHSDPELQPVVQLTIAWAEEMVKKIVAGVEPDDRAIAAARTLLVCKPKESWRTVWPALLSNVTFGRRVLENVSHGEYRKGIFPGSLTEEQLADLFAFLAVQYPHAEDPQYREMIAHCVGPDESVRMFRNTVLDTLRLRGTVAACAAIKRLTTDLPQLPWLADILREAHTLSLRSTWQPPTVGELVALARNNNQTNSSSQEPMKIKVLFVAANPADTDRLALDEEIRAIQQKIRLAEYRDAVELIPVLAARPNDILQALLQYKPHIVHFSGHGSPNAELAFIDDRSGDSKLVESAALEALFRTLRDNVQVVILNACYSHSQAETISKHIPCTIGMNTSIGDEAAIVFAAAFYQAVGFGRSVKEAFEVGVVALRLETIPEESTPQLHTMQGIDAAKVIPIAFTPSR